MLCVCVVNAVNGEIPHGNGGHHGNSHIVSDNGPEEDNSLLIQYLSNLPPPKVVLVSFVLD